jgi:hypothetical protein
MPIIACTEFTLIFSAEIAIGQAGYFKKPGWDESIEYLYGKNPRKLHCPEGTKPKFLTF